MAINNTIFLRRRGKICLPSPHLGDMLPLNYAATLSKNLEALGFGLSEPLIEACRQLSLDELADLYRNLAADLQKLKGAHQEFRPMYRNFPTEVMEMSEGELYLNALLHYWTSGRYLPLSEPKERPPLREDITLQMIDLGTEEEFERLFGQIVSSNASLSDQDKEDVKWFVVEYCDCIAPLMPQTIPQKENMAYLAGLLLAHTSNAETLIGGFCKTATDVLRLAVALSGEDVSLAAPARFRNFSRAERRLLLGLTDRQNNATEDMLRYAPRWVRLGERLHPCEYRGRYPRTAAAFDVVRNGLPYETFNSRIETALARDDVAAAVECLLPRPGDFARRLDHLLRKSGADWAGVVSAFARTAGKVSTPVLLQVMTHFRRRNEPSELRVFFPKGAVAKAQAIENTLPALPADACAAVADVCAAALTDRFGALPPLGKCYVDPKLTDYLVPFSQRSASKAMRTTVRGSRLPLPDCTTLRFFVWWKNGKDRTDIDLSAAAFDEEFSFKDYITYYNLKTFGGHHSGDIVDASEGASEFIDITLDRMRDAGIAYVVMILTSYTWQPYCDLPECFAGWMAREEPGSGEIFEPKTVQDRLDLTADTRFAIPLIIDLIEQRVVWADVALKNNPRWMNNVHGNLSGIQLMLKSLLELKKTSLFDLFTLHVWARGEMVDVVEAADTVFSVENGTPFQIEAIASEYMQ